MARTPLTWASGLTCSTPKPPANADVEKGEVFPLTERRLRYIHTVVMIGMNLNHAVAMCPLAVQGWGCPHGTVTAFNPRSHVSHAYGNSMPEGIRPLALTSSPRTPAEREGNSFAGALSFGPHLIGPHLTGPDRNSSGNQEKPNRATQRGLESAGSGSRARVDGEPVRCWTGYLYVSCVRAEGCTEVYGFQLGRPAGAGGIIDV